MLADDDKDSRVSLEDAKGLREHLADTVSCGRQRGDRTGAGSPGTCGECPLGTLFNGEVAL